MSAAHHLPTNNNETSSFPRGDLRPEKVANMASKQMEFQAKVTIGPPIFPLTALLCDSDSAMCNVGA